MKKNILKLFLVVFSMFIMTLGAFARSPYTIIEYKKGIYIIEINTAKSNYQLVPFVVDKLETNKDVYEQTQAKLVVNAGFFDPKNQKTVSYVVIDGEMVLNPQENENLTGNENLKPYMDKILNRSEFRILEDEKGKKIYDIAPHNEEIANGLKLVHSIQAGPMLYPDLRLEEEFFVLVKNGELKSESASCLHHYARTGIGIKKNKVYIFIATKEAPLTLIELSDIARLWGMEKAMAFDGGGSTSLNCDELNVLSDYANEGRKLKSFLMLKSESNK